MKNILLALTLLASLFTSLSHANKKDPHHREKGAHVHGNAELSIAFEGTFGKVLFESPSESLLGFEHAAKSAADKKAVDAAFKKFENSIAEMMVFDKALQCVFSKDKIEVVMEGENHSDTVAEFTVKCNKSPVGTRMIFNFQKFFPALKTIDAKIIADTLQKSAKIKANETLVELK